jgi:hypothetical protein
METPPTGYRRKRLRRRVALGFLVLLIPIAVGGFNYWRDLQFPARSVTVAGMPVELRVQSGVDQRELRAIRRGLHVTDRFMKRSLGRTVRRHVEARIARTDGCRPFQKAGEAIVGEADRGFLCIDTASPAWRWLMLKDRLAASAAAGHEYVHVLQGELGCLHTPPGENFRWLMEGMAEEVSWQALVAAHRATESGVTREIRQNGAFDRNLGPLQSYEIQGGRDPEYALWHLAVVRLLRQAVRMGAAPAHRPELALGRFCESVGRGTPWRVSFARTFGIPVDRFYARFERGR